MFFLIEKAFRKKGAYGVSRKDGREAIKGSEIDSFGNAGQ